MKRAFTFVEVMVGVVLMSLVLGGAWYAYVTWSRSAMQTFTQSDLVAQKMLLFDFLSRDLRSAREVFTENPRELLIWRYGTGQDGQTLLRVTYEVSPERQEVIRRVEGGRSQRFVFAGIVPEGMPFELKVSGPAGSGRRP